MGKLRRIGQEQSSMRFDGATGSAMDGLATPFPIEEDSVSG